MNAGFIKHNQLNFNNILTYFSSGFRTRLYLFLCKTNALEFMDKLTYNLCLGFTVNRLYVDYEICYMNK